MTYQDRALDAYALDDRALDDRTSDPDSAANVKTIGAQTDVNAKENSFGAVTSGQVSIFVDGIHLFHAVSVLGVSLDCIAFLSSLERQSAYRFS